MNQETFLPFGSQYYRYPTPEASEWEKDFQSMKAHGFNVVKIWAQWRSNHPAPDTYWFDDLDKLMHLAQTNNMKVIINVILDIAPAWFYLKFPDSVMIYADGTKLYPVATEYRQVGGAPGPCYHHPQAIQIKKEFVTRLAHHFANHPALYAWDLWNEPELSCGIARSPSETKMLCYCEHSREAFITWLGNKYHSIEQLNNAWKRNYNSFDEVELPRNPRTFNDMMDWRRFFTETLTEDLASRIQAIRQHDKTTPIMVHTVPPPYFNMINACTDDYQMAKLCDMFGNSTGSSYFPASLSVCSAKNKPVINAEIHAMGGETFNHPRDLSYNEFKSHIFTPLSKGIKGFLFWQFRPELLGRESPAWGLTDLEGNATSNLKHVSQINDYLQKNKNFFYKCQTISARLAGNKPPH